MQKKIGHSRTHATALALLALLAPEVSAQWTYRGTPDPQIRNIRTLHHFQPLAPRYATEQDELAFAVDNLRAFGRNRCGLITDGADVIALDYDECVRHDLRRAGIYQGAVDESNLATGIGAERGTGGGCESEKDDQTKTLHEREVPRLRSE